MRPIISVQSLGKEFRLGMRVHNTLRDQIADWFRARRQASADGSFWALKEVSFDVEEGQVVGLIGRNGAGKSTLLKILSQITDPSEGEVKIRGRVASLLEVGTGFHPELSGRENVFLNGAILGMSRREIRAKFDEIVAFAEVEKFIDTPVKHYSSGMYVRLAFAVAAHLDPEILIVDEVLAVGDAVFQRKCLGKMNDVAKTGRTVLFVSHNMAAIQHLCTHAVLLDKGRLSVQGLCEDVVKTYLNRAVLSVVGGSELATRKDRSGSGRIKFTQIAFEDENGHPLAAVASGMDVVFHLRFEKSDPAPLKRVDVGISLSNTEEQLLFVHYSSYEGKLFDLDGTTGSFRCRIPRLPLAAGRYVVGARLMIGEEEADWPTGGVAFLDVDEGDFYGSGSCGFTGRSFIRVAGQWQVQGNHPPLS